MHQQPRGYGGCKLLIVLTCGVCRLAVAQQSLPNENSVFVKQGGSSSEASLLQMREQVLALSQEILERIDSQGITLESIKEQEKLKLILSQFLKQSSQQQQLQFQPLSLSGTQESQESVNESENRGSSELSGNAGQAPGSQNKNESSPGTLKIREKLADAVWGHLPPQERNDLIRTYSDSYLPGYEIQVRNYFEQLAKLQRRTITKETERTPEAQGDKVE